MSIILAFGRLRQENCSKLKAYLARMRYCQESQNDTTTDDNDDDDDVDDDKTLDFLNHTGH